MMDDAKWSELGKIVLGLGLEDLRKLNGIVVDRIKVERDKRDRKLAVKFDIGQVVSWSHQRVAYKGVVQRVNRKTVTVLATEKKGFFDKDWVAANGQWNVALSFAQGVSK